MTRFVAKRILFIVPILIGVSVIVFALLQLAPGSPIDALVGQYATKAQRLAAEQELGYNRPLPLQYLTWLGNALRGNLGTSVSSQLSVSSTLKPAMINTAILALFAGLLALFGGVTLGSVAVMSKHRRLRSAASTVAAVFASIPQYALALILLAFISQKITWFPVTGMHYPSSPNSFPDLLRHLILPGVAASLVPMGTISRMFRSSLSDVLAQPFVETLRARGFSSARDLRHLIHNALPPLVTIFGIQFSYLLGGVLFVEVVFSWPGIGQVLYLAITQKNYPVILGGVLYTTAAFVVGNLLVDIANAALDPRVRERAVLA